MVIAMMAFVKFLKKNLKDFIAEFTGIFSLIISFLKKHLPVKLIEEKVALLTKKSLLKKRKTGVAVLEACLTLPVLMMMIFFIIEMMKVNNTRTAMDSIALEASLTFVADKNTGDFKKIIEKYRPIYVDKGKIKYYFTVYESLEKMCSVSPFGCGEVFWPNSSGEAEVGTFIDSDGDTKCLGEDDKSQMETVNRIAPEKSFSPTKDPPLNSLTGKVFVLTFVCDYNFSSGFVGKLFGGGANTKDKTKFLIWGRGVGICN